MSDMSAVPTGIADGVFSSHSLEHLYPHEVPVVLREFQRVLKPAGLLVVTCPDLQSICQRVAAGLADQTAYLSPVGPITPLDMLFGHQPQLAAGNLHMAHRFGFTFGTLCEHLQMAGFASIGGFRREAAYDLWVLASRRQLATDELELLLREHLPN
jgi:SAM-dependent methyltransferase